MNVMLGATAKPAAYYLGLIQATTFTGMSSSDTMASHTGWTEYTDYAEATRQTITFGAASDGTITNPTSTNITPNANADVVGFFITTNSTKGGTTGFLFAQDVFDQGTRSVQSGVIEQFTLTASAVNSESEEIGSV